MNALIRPGRAADIGAIKAITVASFHDVSIDAGIEKRFGLVHGRDWRWRKARHIDDDARRPQAAMFVAEREGQVVGYITTWIDAESGIGWIPNMAVDRDHRGHGLGRRLIEHALEHFRGRRIRHVRIETVEQNTAGQHLYPACGFREVARQIHYCLRLDESGRGVGAGDR